MQSKAVPALMSLAGICMAGWSLAQLIFKPREPLCGDLFGSVYCMLQGCTDLPCLLQLGSDCHAWKCFITVSRSVAYMYTNAALCHQNVQPKLPEWMLILLP